MTVHCIDIDDDLLTDAQGRRYRPVRYAPARPGDLVSEDKGDERGVFPWRLGRGSVAAYIICEPEQAQESTDDDDLHSDLR